MPIRPTDSSVSGKLRFGTVVADRPCIGCGYNVRGLPLNARCPECGMPVMVPGEIDDPISRAPRGVILRFVVACWIGTLLLVALAVFSFTNQFGLPAKPATVVLGALATIWLPTVVLLTPVFELPQAAFRGFGPRNRLRLPTRLLALGWLAATTAMACDAWLPTVNRAQIVDRLLDGLERAGYVAGGLSLVLLCLMLEELAEWARDERAKSALNLGVWGGASAAIGLVLGNAIAMIPIVGRLLNGLLGILVLVMWIAVPFAFFSLAGSVTYALRHAGEWQDRLRRRRDRDDAFTEKVKRQAGGGRPET